MSNRIIFTIKEDEEFIELIKLLKVTNIAESGAMAQILVAEEEVKRNGEVELRKRAKIRRGEVIEVLSQEIEVR
ncbi:MAG: RNA-binding S4 domain-containing protein [Bacteroidales bacterium]|nr:RNA-binding S4 domain-containing protein [Candidatus Scybalousia scybalohippi]MCQ2326115.1 RNA-binding S4 domain-containing protein [Bacteroidales bacterium]